MVVPEARTDPLLQGEEKAQQDRTRNKDGRMHEDRLAIVFFPEFQLEILDFLADSPPFKATVEGEFRPHAYPVSMPERRTCLMGQFAPLEGN